MDLDMSILLDCAVHADIEAVLDFGDSAFGRKADNLHSQSS